MPRKQEASWESLVLAGDGTTWSAEDWVWDPHALTAQPKRRSSRVQQQQQQLGKPPRPCAAATRLGAHLAPEAPAADASTASGQLASTVGDDGLVAPTHRAEVHGSEARTSSSGSQSPRGGGGGGGGKAVPKGRAALAGRRPVCQADGCTRDLSTLTYYHQRNRICEVHIKADVFVRDGEELRFCQRCGHSHPLAEFDAGKHSCRKQLEKHNARRRKNPAVSKANSASVVTKPAMSNASLPTSALVMSQPAATATAPAAPAQQQQQQQPQSAAVSLGTMTVASDERSPCASSNNPERGQAAAGAAAGQGPAAAPGARARERLAARIAQLAASGADLSLLEQHAGPAASAATAPQQQQQQQQMAPQQQAQQQQQEQPVEPCGCGCVTQPEHHSPVGAAAAIAAPTAAAAGLAMAAPQPAAPALAPPAGAPVVAPAAATTAAAALKPCCAAAAAAAQAVAAAALGVDLELPSLAELTSELHGPAEGEPHSRALSPLLPLLDFDYGYGEQAGPGGFGAAGQAAGDLADDLSDWISMQLADHAMLCEATATAAGAAGQQGLACTAPAEAAATTGAAEADMMLCLFDDVALPQQAQQEQQQAQQEPTVSGSCSGAGPSAYAGSALQQSQQQGSIAPGPSMAPPGQPHWAPGAAALFGAQPVGHLQQQQQLQQQHHHQQQLPGSFALASGLLGLGGAAPPPLPPPPEAEALITKVSVKLFGCTPDELPTGLRQQIAGWFSGGLAASMEGYIRPGCVHLTVQAVLQPRREGEQAQQGPGQAQQLQQGAEQAQQGQQGCAAPGAAGAAGSRPAHPTLLGVVTAMRESGCDLWRSKTMLVQCGSQLGLVHGSQLRKAWDVQTATARRAVPQVDCVSPPVVVRAPPGSVKLTGVNLMQDNSELLARMRGAYLALPEGRCAECSCRAPLAGAGGAPGPEGGAQQQGAGWEHTCCGCCITRLQPGPAAGESGEGEGAAASSTCGPPERQQPAGTGTQSVQLQLPQELPLGLLHLDVQRGAFSAPQGARVLVVETEAVQQELLALQAQLPSAAYSSVLDQLGVVFEWLGGTGAARPDWGLVQATAARLLYWCVSSGLAATSEALLRVLARGEPAGLAAALQRAAAVACQDGLSLLHRAVQSKSVPMAEAILGWGEEAGAPWQVDLPGPLGLTPLHLAAAVPTSPTASALLEALLLRCAGGAVAGAAAWHTARTADGLTPAQFAAMAGSAAAAEAVLRRLAPALVVAADEAGVAAAAAPEAATAAGGGGLGAAGEAEGQGKAEAGASNTKKGEERRRPTPEPCSPVRQPPTPRRCRCTGDCPCARAREPCTWCTQIDSAWGLEAGSKGGSCCEGGCGDVCGLEGGKCKCCSGGASGAGGGQGGGQGSAGDGGGGGAAGPGGGGAGCCGGGSSSGRSAGQGPSSAGSGTGGGAAGNSGGSCCGKGTPGAQAPGGGADWCSLAWGTALRASTPAGLVWSRAAPARCRPIMQHHGVHAVPPGLLFCLNVGAETVC